MRFSPKPKERKRRNCRKKSSTPSNRQPKAGGPGGWGLTFCHSCGTMSATMSGRAVAGCRPSAERNGTEPRLPSPGWVGLCTLFSRDDGTPSPQGPGAVRLAGRPLPAVWRAGIVLDKTVADHPGLGGPPGGAADKTERNPFPMKMKTIPWKSAFLRVALGQAVSQLGSHGVQFALIWWLAEETASPSWCRRTSWSGPTAGCSCSTAGPSSWGR